MSTRVVPFVILTVPSVLVFGSHGIIDYRIPRSIISGEPGVIQHEPVRLDGGAQDSRSK